MTDADDPAASGATTPIRDADDDGLAAELDALYAATMASLGPSDERYIRRLIASQRRLDLAGRAALTCGVSAPVWIAGVTMLATAKVLENMEIGHNVLHGQWDWLGDPDINSVDWEWDHPCPASQWKHLHNEVHHVWTNVRGRDRDIGYGAVRVDPDRPWRRADLANPVIFATLPLYFDYAIGVHDIETLSLKNLANSDLDAARPRLVESLTKFARLAGRDYVLWPLLAAPFGRRGVVMAAAGALAANTLRNAWTFVVIFNGHFPADVEFFDEAEVDNESKGQWYRRQIRGTANFSGGRLLHTLSGNLGYQVEHHLFPDMPSNRYGEIAPAVQRICRERGIHYNSRSLTGQFRTVVTRIMRLSLPDRIR